MCMSSLFFFCFIFTPYVKLKQASNQPVLDEIQKHADKPLGYLKKYLEGIYQSQSLVETLLIQCGALGF